LSAIKACGGTTVVQDPAEALFPDMPLNALKNAPVDHQLMLREIAELLMDLANSPAPDGPEDVSPRIQTEVEFSKMNKDNENMSELGGTPTAFACPSCHGALWELQDGNLSRYRCHTGHAFSPESLLAEQSDAIEEALYSALRALTGKSRCPASPCAALYEPARPAARLRATRRGRRQKRRLDPQSAQWWKRIGSEWQRVTGDQTHNRLSALRCCTINAISVPLLPARHIPRFEAFIDTHVYDPFCSQLRKMRRASTDRATLWQFFPPAIRNQRLSRPVWRTACRKLWQ
jgi:hypothetical protein